MVSVRRYPSRFRARVLRYTGLAACGVLAACDGSARTPDAQTPTSAYSADLSIRFDVSATKPASVSILGFRAATAGALVGGSEGPDVLGLVDPLSASAPAEGCVLHDVDLTASALRTTGGSVDLEELGGVGVGLGASNAPADTVIRPFPRVYPDVGGIVGGVVAEAGPQPLAALPEHVSLYSPATELPIADLPVPPLPRLLSINGSAPVEGARIDASGGLTLALGSAAGALVELRPFGATVAVSCSVPANASTEALVTVPRALLRRLSARETPGATVPVSLEIARRLRVRAPLGSMVTRVSVETRSALAVEIRP
jgi:hypothetical protein